MLRLKRSKMSINPAHIKRVTIQDKNVSISMVSETGSILVQFKTEQDAIFFTQYVELLVDISNGRKSNNEMVQNFQSYLEHKDVLTPDILYPEHERLKKVLTEQRRKS